MLVKKQSERWINLFVTKLKYQKALEEKDYFKDRMKLYDNLYQSSLIEYLKMIKACSGAHKGIARLKRKIKKLEEAAIRKVDE